MKVDSPEFDALWNAADAAARKMGFTTIYDFSNLEFNLLSEKKQEFRGNDPALWITTNKAMRATLRRALRTLADGI